ncbi:MAG: hypothetical protein FWG34_03820 [Oscillospiraceae bacterium]|jgi:hypothetical protein|nr:hypothetical protein [Oscillospiraceae bacterium]
MNSIIMNFGDETDTNTAYTQLRKQYPKAKITKTSKSLDEMLDDEWLLALAEERKRNDSGVRYTLEEVMAELGIAQEEIDEMEDVEIE